MGGGATIIFSCGLFVVSFVSNAMASKSIKRVDISEGCAEAYPCEHDCTIHYWDGSREEKRLDAADLISNEYWPFLDQKDQKHFYHMNDKDDKEIVDLDECTLFTATMKSINDAKKANKSNSSGNGGGGGGGGTSSSSTSSNVKKDFFASMQELKQNAPPHPAIKKIQSIIEVAVGRGAFHCEFAADTVGLPTGDDHYNIVENVKKAMGKFVMVPCKVKMGGVNRDTGEPHVIPGFRIDLTVLDKPTNSGSSGGGGGGVYTSRPVSFSDRETAK